ncbi:MAG TPA: HD domain-containing phosphohydrolase [Candidatus Dormibacteraeota bacterium]|nr:HD domain-containing phosphohydrolase [Candidatus Dormibacteraeota bacterium]
MAPRRRCDLYRLAVGVAALVAGAFTLGHGGSPPPESSLVAALAVGGILALQFPLHLSLSEKVSVASAVFFAAVLLMPASQAALLVACMQAIDSALSALRRFVARREKPPLGAIGLTVLFNSGQGYFSVLAAGIVLAAFGVSARTGIGGGTQALGVVAAGVVMYGSNLLFVSEAIALATSRNLLEVLASAQKVVSAQSASLYVVGTAAAFAVVRMQWLPVLGVLPVVLAYFSLRHRIELSRDSVRAMERMAEEVDRRDPYTYQHSQRVAIYSHAIGRQLRFSAAEIELVELAAKVHDIGKIRIPDAILLKPAKLTNDERRVMETHPRLGCDILSQFSEYGKVLELVLAHHERYDGRGYPNGTIGRRLPLIAQVIPVADSLDAMTTARAYRGARSWEKAMEELRRGAGTQWNAKVVDAALVALFGEEPQPAAPRTAAVTA